MLRSTRHGSGAAAKQREPGFDMLHAAILRQALREKGALSYEIGVSYNTSASGEGKTYTQIRLINRFWRPWLEFEIKPRADFPWLSEEVEYSLLLGIRVIFEEYLRRE